MSILVLLFLGCYQKYPKKMWEQHTCSDQAMTGSGCLYLWRRGGIQGVHLRSILDYFMEEEQVMKNINLEISVRIQTPYCMLRIRTLSEQRALGKYGWVLLPPSPCIVGHCLIIHLKFSERLLSRSGRCWKPESLTWGNELWQWLPNLGGKLGHSMGYHSGLRGIHQGRKRSLPKKVWHTAYVSTLV